MSSVLGSNSVKQIGQSPETSLRFEGASKEVSDETGAGAAAKISRSSLRFGQFSVRLEGIVTKVILTEERNAS